MYQAGNHISFEHSFPDGKQLCSGVISHIHNDGLGFVVTLDEPQKDKQEVLVLSRCTDVILNSEDNTIPHIEKKSKYKVGKRIKFKHEFSSEDCYRTGEILFVYNDGEGYFVKLDESCREKFDETFFLSNKMLVEQID